MKTACTRNLDVFDFKPETEVSEFANRNKSKLENPRRAIEKYTFLETAASGKSLSAEEIHYVPSLDIDIINMTHMSTTLLQNPSTAGMMSDSNDTFTVVKRRPKPSPEPITDLPESEINAEATSANNKLNSDILDLLPSLHEFDEAVGIDTIENGSMSERSSSSSGVVEDDGLVAEPSLDYCIDGLEMGGGDEDISTVILWPDHMLYCGSYYTESLITFTSSSIEMEGSEVDKADKTFKCKWGIDDILHITSHWYERIEMAMVKIHVLKHSENVECASGSELKFSVIDSSWYKKFEAIVALNRTYKALWTSMLGDSVVGIDSSTYLPIFDQAFEEVVYPKGDADAVSISKRDFDLLEPDTFVNDTIIDFYIKYLKNKIKADQRHRYHFFNSFFFRKLADPDKDPLDASKGEVAYQRVKKWTRKVNLFEKDYVFVPVNYNYHWSLIVMCHLGEVATDEDEDVNESMKVPCILHMDSIRGSHSGLKGLVQSYLKEEWKARQPSAAASEDISSRFDNLRFISLELPQQQNLSDCGMFLLHYVELFLEQAPKHFNPFKISKRSHFLNVDWFVPAEASLKRVVIQKLICDLLENPNLESYSTAGNNSPTHKGTVVNLSIQDPLMHHQEVEMPSSSSIQRAADDHNLILKPSFESEFCTTTFYVCEAPIKEDVQQQNNGITLSSQDWRTPPVTTAVSNHHEPLPEIPNSDPLNESNSETSEPHTLRLYVDQMGDVNVDITTPFKFPEMQMNGPDDFSGLESDVQHPSKKMRRITQP